MDSKPTRNGLNKKMKKVLAGLLLIIASLNGISPASGAITCPAGTVISTQDSTKCISSTIAYIPTDRTTIYTCPQGTTLTTDNKCLTPGYYVQGGTYQGTPRYMFFCSGQTLGSDGYCHVPLNPPIVNSIYSPGTPTYTCSTYPYLSLSGSNCYSINNYSQNIPATNTGTTYPVCQSGYTRSGDNCTKTIYEILQQPTQVIDGYDCNGTVSASQTCYTSGYMTSDSLSDPVQSYQGTCSTWLIFSKTTGLCSPYVFSPDTPITQTIYQCVITGWATIPTTVFYNYDASVVAPFGKSITCQPTTITPTSETRDGVYICTSINMISGNIYYYASEIDATGATATVETNCDFSINEVLSPIEEDLTYDYSTNDDCDNIVTFSAYMTCLASKYV